MAMNKLFFSVVFLFNCLIAFAQKPYQKYEGQEFLRQAQLTKEYKAAKEKADRFNLDTTQVPQEVKFIIVRQKELGIDPDTLVGHLTRELAIGPPLESYELLYDRNRKKIVSIKGGMNSNVQILK